MATTKTSTNGKTAAAATEDVETAAPVAALQIDRIPAQTILVPIIGTSPLIVHRFSEKAKRQMLDAQQGRKKIKEMRDPNQDFMDSRYRMDDGADGFPVLGFKAATVGAARFYDKSVTMVSLRQSLFMHGEQSVQAGQALVRIEGECEMREDMVRVGQGTDLRYRAEFRTWSAVLQITYISSQLAQSSVLALIDAGGMGIGVGEWRPEKKGDFGTYAIDQTRAVEVLNVPARTV